MANPWHIKRKFLWQQLLCCLIVCSLLFSIMRPKLANNQRQLEQLSATSAQLQLNLTAEMHEKPIPKPPPAVCQQGSLLPLLPQHAPQLQQLRISTHQLKLQAETAYPNWLDWLHQVANTPCATQLTYFDLHPNAHLLLGNANFQHLTQPSTTS